MVYFTILYTTPTNKKRARPRARIKHLTITRMERKVPSAATLVTYFQRS